MTRSNIYVVGVGIGNANNLRCHPMYIFTGSNVYRIIRDTDIEYDNEQHPRLIQKLKQIQRQYNEIESNNILC